MEDLVLYAISAAGAVTLWWRHLRRPRRSLSGAPSRDEELEIAISVATHDALARAQPLTAEHLLFGLLQTESIARAIASAGGTCAVAEDAVLAALLAREGADRQTSDSQDSSDQASAALAMLAWIAHQRDRAATCADLWFALQRRSQRVRDLLLAAGIDPIAVLFVLAHGVVEPVEGVEPGAPSSSGSEDELELILVNDDFSTQVVVVEALRRAFALPVDEATRLMLKVHHEGQTSLGRHRADHARSVARSVTAFARERGYPLWIRLQP